MVNLHSSTSGWTRYRWSLVVVVLFAMNWRLALVSLCIAPVWVRSCGISHPGSRLSAHRMQETLESMSGEVHERIAGATTIKSFGARRDEISLFRVRSETLCDRAIDKVKLAARQEMLIQLSSLCTDDRDWIRAR